MDDTKSPAYYGTSIETRSDDGAVMEIRENTEEEDMNIDYEKLADLVADRVAEKLKPPTEENRAEETPEENKETEVTGEAEATVETETTETAEEAEETEQRAIDYSSFEERIAKLN